MVIVDIYERKALSSHIHQYCSFIPYTKKNTRINASQKRPRFLSKQYFDNAIWKKNEDKNALNSRWLQQYKKMNWNVHFTKNKSKFPCNSNWATFSLIRSFSYFHIFHIFIFLYLFFIPALKDVSCCSSHEKCSFSN